MINTRNILSIILLGCSLIISFIGLRILWTTIPTLFLTLENSFFDKEPARFQLLLSIYAFGASSIGFFGSVAFYSILRKKPGAEHFLFSLIFLYITYFTLLELKASSTNYLNLFLNTAPLIVIGVISWFAFCRKVSFSFKTNSNKFVLETTLLIFIFSQLARLYIFNPVENNLLIKLENQKIYGPLPEKSWECYEFAEKKMKQEYENCINYLVSNGYEDDRGMLFQLALVEISNGNNKKAIEHLNHALSVDYIIKDLTKTEKLGLFEEAQMHYILYILNKDLGFDEESQSEYNLYVTYTKQIYGGDYSKKSLERVKEMSINAIQQWTEKEVQ